MKSYFEMLDGFLINKIVAMARILYINDIKKTCLCIVPFTIRKYLRDHFGVRCCKDEYKRIDKIDDFIYCMKYYNKKIVYAIYKMRELNERLFKGTIKSYILMVIMVQNQNIVL